MPGGLMQLVVYGAQDIYLTGNPQITFFKVVYRRYTNFSIESIENTFNNKPNFGKKVSIIVKKKGDLINKCYFQTTLPNLNTGATAIGYIREVGHHLLKTIEIEIGGQKIDKHYGEWLSIWNDLTLSKSKEDCYNNMIGNINSVYGQAGSGTSINSYTVYIPLQFWFCRNIGLALPLIALQFHDVKINIEINKFRNLYWGVNNSGNESLSNSKFWIDYIYLDTEERRRFAKISHEYLIEQIQLSDNNNFAIGIINPIIKMDFNYPVKEFIWVVQRSDAIDNPSTSDLDTYNLSNWTNSLTSANTGINPIITAKIQINGHDRFEERKSKYFNLVQPYQHHTRIPTSSINVYSFALKPEDHQPSGTANMSKINKATLNLTVDSTIITSIYNVKIFAINYNILKFMSGMGGLAYTN